VAQPACRTIAVRVTKLPIDCLEKFYLVDDGGDRRRVLGRRSSGPPPFSYELRRSRRACEGRHFTVLPLLAVESPQVTPDCDRNGLHGEDEDGRWVGVLSGMCFYQPMR